MSIANTVYLYGKNPLEEAILASKRDNRAIIEKLYLTKDAQENPRIMSLVQGNKLPYETITFSEIESRVGKGTVHQGICAEVRERDLYTPLEEVLVSVKDKQALFVLLDELQDPHNVGAIIRSAKAFGADAILLPEFDQTQITGTVIKTASGMNFAIPIVRIGNINTTLKNLKDKGFWAYGLTGDGDTKLHNAKFDTSCVIVIGAEGAGIRAKTLENCDFKLSIEIAKECESLNASVAAAVTLYEWKRQNA